MTNVQLIELDVSITKQTHFPVTVPNKKLRGKILHKVKLRATFSRISIDSEPKPTSSVIQRCSLSSTIGAIR